MQDLEFVAHGGLAGGHAGPRLRAHHELARSITRHDSCHS
jgi:hypothetical protein